MPLPKILKSYFWDVDFQNLDSRQYAQFVLARILNYGDEKALNWAKKHFSRNEIKKVLLSSRLLDRKSFNFLGFNFWSK